MKKKMCLLGALTLSLSLLTSCPQVQARIAIKDGNEAYSKEEYASALKHYTRARQIDPKGFPDLDRMIGYYEPYATSHQTLDGDRGLQQEVRNVGTAVARTIRALRAGELKSQARDLPTLRPK